MDILIFGGQSNMQGETEVLLGADPVPGAWEYRYLTDSLIPLKNPAGENIRPDGTPGRPYTEGTVLQEWLDAHVLGAACYGRTTMVPEFCRAYREVTGREVAAVHAAKGSTMVHEWLPGTPGHTVLIKKAAAAIRKVQDPGRIFFVWLQGESDAIFQTSCEEYMARCRTLCAALKTELGVEKFGVIRVGRFTNDDRDLEIFRAQDRLCREDPDFLLLTDIAVTLNATPEAMNPFVVGHFSAKGQEMLGRAAGRALGEYAK